jgi:hypothetical protein
MIRTQIQFTEQQFRRLKALAREQGISLAELVRDCVNHFLTKESPSRRELYARASSLVGAFEDRDGATDLAVGHDRYLDESFR